MRHQCIECKKTFNSRRMVLHEYHDGADWYCTSCYKQMVEKLAKIDKEMEHLRQQQEPPCP